MNQSRRMSFVEAATNTAAGYVLAVGTQMAVFPVYGLDVAMPEHLAIGAVFVIVSLIRSFALRRLFERLRPKRALNRPLRTSEAD